MAGFTLGSGVMTVLYFGIVSLAEGREHAASFFIEELRYILPLILGFGVQSSLYVVLKKQLFVPVSHMGSAGAMTGAGGTTSTLAMVACCAHHVTDVLPILGLSAAAAVLTEYQNAFMFLGLMTTMIGIGFMIRILIRERNKVIGQLSPELSGKRLLGKPYLPLGLGIVVVGWIAMSPITSADAPDLQNLAPTLALQSLETESYPLVLAPVPTDTRLWFSGVTQIDEQGAVVIEVTPLHLNQQNNMLYFGVAMNTHSVDLSMDLAKLATLTLEDATTVSASRWDGPAGGHHVSGVLSFELTEAQMDLLFGVNRVSLSLFEVDALERVYLWQEGK